MRSAFLLAAMVAALVGMGCSEDRTVSPPMPTTEAPSAGPMLAISPDPGPALHIETISTHDVSDHGRTGGGNEFEIVATDANGVTQEPHWRCVNIGAFVVIAVASWPQRYCDTSPTTFVHNSAPGEVPYIDIDVVETDGGTLSDDHWVDCTNRPCRRPRVGANSLHQWTFHLYNGANVTADGLETAWQCSQRPDCPFVELVFQSLAVDFASPSTITHQGTATWTAMPSGSSTGSYTYQWQYQPERYVNWTTMGTDRTASLNVDWSTPSFKIRVIVTADGVTATSRERFVNVALQDPPPPDCGHYEQRDVLDDNGEATGTVVWVWVSAPCDNPPPCTPGHYEQRPVLDENGSETGSYENVWVPEDPPGCT